MLKRKKIAFCHIHKTAGTTLSNYLHSNYPREEIFPVDRLDGLTQRLIDSINDYWLIVGHFPLSFLRAFLSSEWKIITVLRDPEARFVSHLAFNHQLAHVGAEVVPPMDLSQLSGDIEAFSDFQTKTLGAWLSRDEWRYLVATRKVHVHHKTTEWLRGGSAAALRIASEELARIDAVLWDQSLDGGLRRVAIDYGLWPVDELPVTNRGDYRGVQSDAARLVLHQIAAEQNLQDLSLCELARQHLVEPPTDAEWAAYHARWMGQYEPARSFVLAADHLWMGTGWVGPNFTADGNGFFWSVTTLAQFLYLPITTAGAYEMELALYLPKRKDGFLISMRLDGRLIEPISVQFPDDRVYVKFQFEREVKDVNRMTLVEFVSDCSTQIREPGGIPNAGFVMSAAIGRLLRPGA